MTDRVMKVAEVKAVTGKSRAQIYTDMNTGTFPRAKKTGKRSVGWRASEIQDWIQNLKTA